MSLLTSGQVGNTTVSNEPEESPAVVLSLRM